MPIDTISKPSPLDSTHAAAPLAEHRPPTPKILPAKRSFRVLVGLMALVPLAIAIAAIVISSF